MSTRHLWLITNIASGSNTPGSVAQLEQLCHEAGLRIAQHSGFPARDLPSPAMLDAAGIDLVAIFAGDGTVNAALAALAGWQGSVLVLPGGTMNLLHRRLFGAASLEATLRLAASGNAPAGRPAIIEGPGGPAYTGVMAGPGTAWNDVREALRDIDLVNLASDMREAMAHSLAGPMVRCIDPPLGREDGYPLIMVSPSEEGIVIKAYFAENLRDYLDQGFALARREFRDGPHDLLGTARQLTLSSVAGGECGLLIDGEPSSVAGPIRLTLARASVNLLAGQTDGA